MLTNSREYLNIFVYLKVMLESFLQAQKISIRKELQRVFRKYVSIGEDKNQLLMHQLQGLFRDAEMYNKVMF